jgi:hypothetical protein
MAAAEDSIQTFSSLAFTELPNINRHDRKNDSFSSIASPYNVVHEGRIWSETQRA